MGKKVSRILAIVACAFALCFVLSACGSSKDYASDFVGYYQVVSMEFEGESLSADDMDTLREYGLDVVMVLDEDGTGEINLLGEVEDIEWKATGEGEGTITIDGAEGNISLSDGELTITEDDEEAGNMVFASISEDEYEAAVEAMG